MCLMKIHIRDVTLQSPAARPYSPPVMLLPLSLRYKKSSFTALIRGHFTTHKTRRAILR